jgi:transcription elongation factor
MQKTLIAPLLIAGILAGCDAATEIAGEAVQGEVRNAVAAQCKQIAENAGVVAGRVAEVCKCSADTFMADSDLTLDDVTRENIEGIVNRCASDTDSASETGTGTMPTEDSGG